MERRRFAGNPPLRYSSISRCLMFLLLQLCTSLIFRCSAGETWGDSEIRSDKCTKFIVSLAQGRVDSSECNPNLYNWVGTMGIPGMLAQAPLQKQDQFIRLDRPARPTASIEPHGRTTIPPGLTCG